MDKPNKNNGIQTEKDDRHHVVSENGSNHKIEKPDEDNNSDVPDEQEGGQEDESLQKDGVRGDDTHPVDTGWAWMVLMGAVIQMLIIIGILKSAGILFVAFQERFKSNASMTSLLSSVQNGCYSIAAPIVMTVGVKLASNRTLVFIGSVLVSTSYIITSQAQDIRVLLFSYGVLQGVGCGFLMPIALTMVAMYFDKRRGLANCLALSGGSLGGLILAPLLTAMLQTFGYSGCVLIVAGIILHGCISASLYRPLTYYMKTTRAQLPVEKISVADDNDKIQKQLLLPRSISNTDKYPQTFHTDSSENGLTTIKSIIDDRKAMSSTRSLNIFNRSSGRQRTFSSTIPGDHDNDNVHKSLSKMLNTVSMEYMCSSVMDMRVNLEPETRTGKSQTDLSDDDKQSCGVFKLITSMFDFKLFKNPMFLIFELAASNMCPGLGLAGVYVAPFAKDIAMDGNQIALLVTILSAIDLGARIMVGLIADKGWLRRSSMIGIAALIVGIMSNLMRWFSSFSFLLLYSIVLGIFGGVYFSLFAVVIVDYLGMEKLQSVLGFTTLSHGASIALHFYMVGFLRDITGSYVAPFHLLGCLTMAGSALMFLMPVIERRYKT